MEGVGEKCIELCFIGRLFVEDAKGVTSQYGLRGGPVVIDTGWAGAMFFLHCACSISGYSDLKC